MKRLLSEVVSIKHIIIVAISILFIVIFKVFLNLTFLNPVQRSMLNFRMTDIFYEISNSGEVRDTSDIITIVDMTEIYERSRLADILDTIKMYEPAIVGVDIVFDGLKGDTIGSERIAEVAFADDNVPVIWAEKLIDYNDDTNQFDNTARSFFAKGADIKEGYTNVMRDINGGTVRSFGIWRMAEGHKEYSLPAYIATQYKDSTVLSGAGTNQSINYSATYFPVLTPEEIKLHPELIRSHIVLFGAMHDEQDRHYTPIGRLPGVEILAYTVQTIVKHNGTKEVRAFNLWLITILLIWFYQLMSSILQKRLLGSRRYVVKYLGMSGIGESFFRFFFIFFLAYVCYVLFVEAAIYFNTAWAMAGIALLGNARKWYAFIINIKGLNIKHNK